MEEKERIQDILAFKVINLFRSTFKARLMDKLPLHKESFFCKGVYCYVSSMVELRRSEREFLPDMYTWLKSFKPGEVFYDIGANIGMFSLTVAKIFNQEVKTYAFEPSFSTFASLARNVATNGFDTSIYPFCIALGNTSGMRVFNYTDLTSGASVHTLDATLNQMGGKFAPIYRQKIISYSLDDLVTQFGFEKPNHIKIDVDGGEGEIVDGMRHILSSSDLKSVMIEVTETNKDDEGVGRIVAIFEEAGFQREFDVRHPGYKDYPFVFDILFTKNWKLSHVSNPYN